MGQRAWFQSSAILGASFFNSARTKRLFSERLIVSDELLVLQWRSRIFVQKLILFNFYPFWHISYHNNVAQKWAIRDSPWGESCVPLEKMLPRTAKVSYKNRALLTNHEANLARFWVSSFLFAFLWTETEVRSIKTRKRTNPVSMILTEDLVNQGFITWLKSKLFLVQTTGFASSWRVVKRPVI